MLELIENKALTFVLFKWKRISRNLAACLSVYIFPYCYIEFMFSIRLKVGRMPSCIWIWLKSRKVENPLISEKHDYRRYLLFHFFVVSSVIIFTGLAIINVWIGSNQTIKSRSAQNSACQCLILTVSPKQFLNL